MKRKGSGKRVLMRSLIDVSNQPSFLSSLPFSLPSSVSFPSPSVLSAFGLCFFFFNRLRGDSIEIARGERRGSRERGEGVPVPLSPLPPLQPLPRGEGVPAPMLKKERLFLMVGVPSFCGRCIRLPPDPPLSSPLPPSELAVSVRPSSIPPSPTSSSSTSSCSVW